MSEDIPSEDIPSEDIPSEDIPNIVSSYPEIYDPLWTVLSKLTKRVVVIGSVARRIRQGFGSWPKDLDLFWDMDSDPAKEDIERLIRLYDIKFQSPFISAWTFWDYGWMVEIMGIHYGPDYRIVRRNASKHTIDGIEFWVAQPEDTPVPPNKELGKWVTWPGATGSKQRKRS